MKKEKYNSGVYRQFNFFKPVFKFIAVVFILFFVSPTEMFAQNGLLINPRRIIFNGKKNTQQINLINTGKDTASYAISFVQYRMEKSGEFVQISKPDSGQFFASNHLQLYPRFVTLAPGEAQVVKAQVRDYHALSTGEYRSHIYFRELTHSVPLGMNKVKDSTALTVRIVAVFGISIPVFIEKGNLKNTVCFIDISFKKVHDTIPKLNLTFSRTGNSSVYGDLTVDYISPDHKKTRVGLVRGIAVYSPNKLRDFSMTLKKGIDYKKGKLQLIYKENSGIKPKVLTIKYFNLH